ncbi:hypothetical protein [Natrialba swarupiae]|uniref:Uncharacterized protein n=1 Tax=Natrialba swarupiae TaxID=2448032 RepID=A0A5D5AN03_9EURY|nr:hypothetical protein [Natrialba swarupiae]TYT62383.1 hypothetical protein FYC77_09215 [Natrialba swarupiae]
MDRPVHLDGLGRDGLEFWFGLPVDGLEGRFRLNVSDGCGAVSRFGGARRGPETGGRKRRNGQY